MRMSFEKNAQIHHSLFIILDSMEEERISEFQKNQWINLEFFFEFLDF